MYIYVCIYVRVNPRTSVSTSISQHSPNFHVPPSLPSSPNSNIFLRTRTVEPSFQSIPGNSTHGIILERTCLRYSTFHARVPNHVISISKQTLEGRTTPLLRDDAPQNTFVFKLFQKLFNSYDDITYYSRYYLPSQLNYVLSLVDRTWREQHQIPKLREEREERNINKIRKEITTPIHSLSNELNISPRPLHPTPPRYEIFKVHVPRVPLPKSI